MSKQPASTDAMTDAMTHDAVTPADFTPSGGAQESSPWVGRMVLAAVLFGLFVLAFGAWFMFSGRSVQIDVSPAPEELTVEGAFLKLNLGDRWLLLPGEYRIAAALPGYFGLDEAITVGDAAEQSFSFELTKKPDRITLDIQPADTSASVTIDGEDYGVAPIRPLELAEGEYEVVLTAPRYVDRTLSVEVTGGGQDVAIPIVMEEDWADVSISSAPPGATLYVDGEPAGETPASAEILSGERALELRLQGYKPWNQTFDIVARRDMTIAEVTLEKADHIVNLVSVPGGASVTIDGEYLGQTPLEVALRPNSRYQVAFSKAGYRPNSRQLEVVAGDDTRLSVQLQPILGTVLITDAPAGSTAFINGTRRGPADEPLELPAHPQRIEVRKEGYQTQSITVTPNPNAVQRLTLNMVSDAAIAAARRPSVLDTQIGYTLQLFEPSGIFRLGSPRREQGRRSNEYMRQVELQRAFYFGTYEVTNQQFQRFRAEHDSNVVGNQTLALDKQPVVRVSWDDAARFANWVSAREGLPEAYRESEGRMVPVQPANTGFRLPTEAEWAMIARYEGSPEGRAALKYAWGDQIPPPQGAANLAGSEAGELVNDILSTYTDPFVATSQVGQFTANGAGIYDLAGNVSEWMHDFYELRPAGASSPATDPMGPLDAPTHVVRGASWRSGSITELRLAWRGDGTEARDDIGIRLARYAE